MSSGTTTGMRKEAWSQALRSQRKRYCARAAVTARAVDRRLEAAATMRLLSVADWIARLLQSREYQSRVNPHQAAD